MTENEIATKIIGCALKVHQTLGPGLLESVYENALCYELHKLGLKARAQVAVPLVYEDIYLEVGYRLDILVENKVIVEIKSVEMVSKVHYSQLLTYLRLSDKRLGLLINFNSYLLRDGIRRMVNDLRD